MDADADVAELADALDLGSSVFDVKVQVLSSAPYFQIRTLCRLVKGSGFCFLLSGLRIPIFATALLKEPDQCCAFTGKV
jgi:hypothetical protein